MKRNFTCLTLLLILVFAVALPSCKKFEGPQKVPAYIHIESIEVDPNPENYFVYGANTSKITDAWVHIDDQLIGVYELPATFPVLKKGPHKVTVYGGIKVDGRSSARDRYPFYQRVVYENLNLVEDSIVNLQPVVSYYPINNGTNIAWMEDFENANTLLPVGDSTIGASRVTGDEAWHSVNSFWSGKVELPPDTLDFMMATADEFDFYKGTNGVYCLLEMDYNCNDTFCVGVQYYENYTLETKPLVKVTPTDKTHDKPQRWNKIYINIGPMMNNYASSPYFKVYFTSDLTAANYMTYGGVPYGHEYHPISEPRYYYFDNLKLLYRNL